MSQRSGERRTTRPSALQDILSAVFEMRRAEAAGENVERAGNMLSSEDFSRVLADLVGGATMVLDDDENDPDYRPEGDAEDEAIEEDDDEDDEEGEQEGEIDDDDEEHSFGYGWNRPIRSHGKWYEEVKEPKQEGLSLLYSGEFGRINHQTKSRNKDANVAKLLLNRGTKLRPTTREDFSTDLVPNSDGTAVATYMANAYVGQYSSDSSFYYTCVRDFRLHVYDTTAPIIPTVPQQNRQRTRTTLRDGDHNTSMKVIKTIRAHQGGWTITDSHLSPDNQRIIYATVSNLVYMAHTRDSTIQQHAINFADPHSHNQHYSYGDPYGVWSCKFSADGNEVIGGGTDWVFVYDLLAEKRTVKIRAHEDDINSCCWADTASGNVLVSASDDSFLKVWDRRSLGSSPKPSGVLIGHTEGITYVSAKGDGRYVISNGKDQVCRLWDLRKMRSSLEFDQVRGRHYGIANYDYRSGVYPKPKHKAHPLDCSVMSYSGHAVLRTLIRCHFSPAETTGGQYIYSGGADGRIHIWSLDGRVVQVLDRSATLPISYDPSEPQPPENKHPRRTVCVRDVSWHSQQPILMSAGWQGSSGWGLAESSVIARHEWKGLSKMRYSLKDHVEKERLETAERTQRMPQLSRILSTRLFMPGSYYADDLVDDDM